MHALIMAGGVGSRLERGEKPLILVRGKPMIAYVIDAFSCGRYCSGSRSIPKNPYDDELVQGTGHCILQD